MAIVVVGEPFYKTTAKSKQKVVMVQCDCGKQFATNVNKVKDRKSCGCKSKVTHGCSRVGRVAPEYRSWCSMKKRCENPLSHNWEHYGGRGITVCERWQSFEAFIEDMGPRPSNATIERIDNSLGYFPENCRWATKSEQARNRRSNTMLTIDGKTMCLTDWLDLVDTKQSTVSQRLRYGWSHKEAVFGKTK